MSKRFTDTNKWRKPFVRSLQAPYKLFWLYLLDDCDHAGIWIVDIEVAEIRIGETLDLEEIKWLFKEKIVVFDNGERWFIPDFVEFQYGELSESNRAHNSVIKTLKRYNLINKQNKPLVSPLQGAKDKDKDKEKDKDKDKEIIYPFDSENFMTWWGYWKEYKKKEHKFKYATAISEQAALKKLSELSSGNEKKAIDIIEHSMSQGWKGFFPPDKDQNQGMTLTEQLMKKYADHGTS